MMNFAVPLSLTVSDGAVQSPPPTFVFCCKCHPFEGEGQETTALRFKLDGHGAFVPGSMNRIHKALRNAEGRKS